MQPHPLSEYFLLALVTIGLLVAHIHCEQAQAKGWSSSHKKYHPPLVAFYDVATNKTILPPFTSPANEPAYQVKGLARGFGRKCDCHVTGSGSRMANVCSCCAGLTLPRLKVQREMCTRFQYNLAQRNQMVMDVTMNGRPIGSNTYNLRAQDFQPLCIPLPIPYIPLRFDFCIKIFEVALNGANVHFCMDWSARIEKAPIILLHFDCLEFGAGGISLLKPGQIPDAATGGFPSIIQPPGGGGGGGGSGSGLAPPISSLGGNQGGGVAPPISSGGVNTGGGTGSGLAPPISSLGGSSGGGLAPPSTSGGVNPVNTGGGTGSGLAPPISSLGGSSGGDSSGGGSSGSGLAPSTSSGVDANGNLPQVGGDGDDFDPVEDLKLKEKDRLQG